MKSTQTLEYEYLLIGDLRDLLGERDDEGVRQWLQAVIDEIVNCFPGEMEAYEEDGGYLHEVLEACPWCDSKVQDLRHKKVMLQDRMIDLRERLVSAEGIQPIAAWLQNELGEWIEQFTTHRRAEAELMHESLIRDYGCN